MYIVRNKHRSACLFVCPDHIVVNIVPIFLLGKRKSKKPVFPLILPTQILTVHPKVCIAIFGQVLFKSDCFLV